MYKKENIKSANKTSRANGAIGGNAVVPKYVKSIASKSDTILDFGAGKHALHARLLSQDGFNVIAYDFGDNLTEYHSAKALRNKVYDIVIMSNVLNVQQSTEMLKQTLIDVSEVMDNNTRLFANYPNSPRYLGLTKKELQKELKSFGFQVDNINKDIMQIKLG